MEKCTLMVSYLSIFLLINKWIVTFGFQRNFWMFGVFTWWAAFVIFGREERTQKAIISSVWSDSFNWRIKSGTWLLLIQVSFKWKLFNIFQGSEYDFVEDWGEQLVGKSQPVICIFKVNWEPFQSEDGVRILEASDDWSPGQVRLWLLLKKKIVIELFICFLFFLGF